MSCAHVTPTVTETLTALSAVKTYLWFTTWRPMIGMTAAEATLKVRNLANTFGVQVAYQTAVARTDRPDTPQPIGTRRSTSGEYLEDAAAFDLAAVSPGKTFIRFGVAVDVSTTPNRGSADVAFQMVYLQCGTLMEPWSGTLVATSTTPQYVPISGFLPCLGVYAVAATIMLSGVQGSIEVALAYRTAVASQELPGAWADVPSSPEYSADGEQNNTGELTPTTSGKMWVQFGLRFNLTAGTLGQVDIVALLGIRTSA